MIASLLRLVLALTLAFNGISAPMAMAHGTHSSHLGADATTGPGSHPAGHAGHGSSAHEGHHKGHGSAVDDGTSGDPLVTSGCCGGPECRCGCILPPALPLASAVAVRHVLPQLAPAKDVDRAPSLALAAPFRPPSR